MPFPFVRPPGLRYRAEPVENPHCPRPARHLQQLGSGELVGCGSAESEEQREESTSVSSWKELAYPITLFRAALLHDASLLHCSVVRNPLIAEVVAEAFGTFILILFGTGVVAMVVLFGQGVAGEVVNGGFTNITLAWGLGVTMAVFISPRKSAEHISIPL